MKNKDVFKHYGQLAKEAIKELKTKGRRHKQIPNILTLMRLPAPFFIIPAAIIGNVPAVIGLTAFFGLTDLADGFVARKWKLTSELGVALDAVADKVFASTLLLAASIGNPMLVCNLGLELAIASINVSKKLNGIEVASTYIGKAKTWFLFALAGVGIVSPILNMESVLNPLIISTTIMQTLSLASYITPASNTTNINASSNNEQVTRIIEEKTDTKIKKEKVLEKDDQPMVKQNDEREDLKQLRAIREELTTIAPTTSSKKTPPSKQKTKTKSMNNKKLN